MPDRIDARDATAARLPPGQIVTQKWPVLHSGTVPTVDLATWRFDVAGAVERPFSLTWDELLALPRRETACDIHCVTRWSRYDNMFEGVPVQALLARAGVQPEAPLRPGARRAGLHDQPAARRTSTGRTTCWPSRTTGSRSRRSTAGRCGCWCRTSTSGRARSGCGASSCWRRTTPGSGSRTATTCGAIRGRGAVRPARSRAHAAGRAIAARHPPVAFGPTRFSCLSWQNRPDVRPPRRRRSSGSPRSCGRRTAGRGGARGARAGHPRGVHPARGNGGGPAALPRAAAGAAGDRASHGADAWWPTASARRP